MDIVRSTPDCAASNVAIVDDDPSVRQALARLVRAEGHCVQTFSCAQEFLRYSGIADIGCLVLDIQLPDLDGLELQSVLERQEYSPAIVFLTGYGDIPLTVRAIRAGAVDFLTKPCAADVLLDAVGRALRMNARQRSLQRAHRAERTRFESLTQREREVLQGIVRGLRNKQIAAQLNICEKTVKVHRAHIMEKMAVRSVAELVRIAEHVSGTADNQTARAVVSVAPFHAGAG